jgi:hypothetical protein
MLRIEGLLGGVAVNNTQPKSEASGYYGTLSYPAEWYVPMTAIFAHVLGEKSNSLRNSLPSGCRRLYHPPRPLSAWDDKLTRVPFRSRSHQYFLFLSRLQASWMSQLVRSSCPVLLRPRKARCWTHMLPWIQPKTNSIQRRVVV